MYLLDTNVVSELRRPSRAAPQVVACADLQPLASMYLSVVSVMELELGVLLIERRDPRQGAVLRRWLEADVFQRFDDRILPVDVAVARCAARLHAPDPGSRNDTFIAATAIVRGLTVASRNTADFAPTGVALINPWEFGAA